MSVDDQMNAQMFYFTDSSKKDQKGVINLMEISKISVTPTALESNSSDVSVLFCILKLHTFIP